MVEVPAIICPSTVEELAAAVRDAEHCVIAGCGTKAEFRLPTPQSDRLHLNAARRPLDDPEIAPVLEAEAQQIFEDRASELSKALRPAESLMGWTWIDTRNLRGIVDYHAADQVVIVRAGTMLSRLQRDLEDMGQILPLPYPAEYCDLDEDRARVLSGWPGTLGGMISTDLPHALEAQCGTWRDWILGMTVVRPDGTVARCGSQAVKNVAGYDVQKLMVGARGTLGVIAEVILRTHPKAALPRPLLTLGPAKSCNRIQRVMRTDFAQALDGAGKRLYAADEASSTLWLNITSLSGLWRYAGDWVLGAGAREYNLEITDRTQISLMKRTKEIFDPTHKLNPGEMGIF